MHCVLDHRKSIGKNKAVPRVCVGHGVNVENDEISAAVAAMLRLITYGRGHIQRGSRNRHQ